MKKGSGKWHAKRAAIRRYWQSRALRHPDPAPSDEELLMMIERDFIPDEETFLTPNPKGGDTYYERVNGGPWVRRY